MPSLGESSVHIKPRGKVRSSEIIVKLAIVTDECHETAAVDPEDSAAICLGNLPGGLSSDLVLASTAVAVEDDSFGERAMGAWVVAEDLLYFIDEVAALEGRGRRSCVGSTDAGVGIGKGGSGYVRIHASFEKR